jgi:hypothetical protein
MQKQQFVRAAAAVSCVCQQLVHRCVHSCSMRVGVLPEAWKGVTAPGGCSLCEVVHAAVARLEYGHKRQVPNIKPFGQLLLRLGS